MSTLHCTSDTITAHLLALLLLGDLISFCCFLTSHPLPLAYFLLSSPYLLPLLSFLTPLLISTSLLLLLTLLLTDPSPQLPSCTFRFFLQLSIGTKSHDHTEQFDSIARSNDTHHLVQLAQTLLGHDIFRWDSTSMEDPNLGKCKLSGSQCGDENVADASKAPLQGDVGRNPVRSTSTRRKEHRRRASEGAGMKEAALQRDGSTRKDKEWKRTLACKLYEERVTFKLCEKRRPTTATGDKGEEMDFLWEAYEDDAIKKDTKSMTNKTERDDHEEVVEGRVGQLCCLQALKISGKMHMGVGRPNLVKVSKILNRIGLFRSVKRV